eukprot:3327234-Alexandrium_andersonii.AAC.1
MNISEHLASTSPVPHQYLASQYLQFCGRAWCASAIAPVFPLGNRLRTGPIDITSLGERHVECRLQHTCTLRRNAPPRCRAKQALGFSTVTPQVMGPTGCSTCGCLNKRTGTGGGTRSGPRNALAMLDASPAGS